MDILITICGWAAAILSVVFVAASVILFVRDGIAAKREGRKISTKYTVMFIIGMTIAGCWLMILIFIQLLSFLVMRSM